MNIDYARQNLPMKLANVQEVSKGVLRGIRRNGEYDIAVYFFDFNGRINDVAENLDSYQDELIGKTYFDVDVSADLRWNHYLYMVNEEGSVNKELSESIRKIQSDQSYARKFVIASNQLETVISQINHVPTTVSGDVGNILEVWSGKLSSAGLDCVLDVEKTLKDTVRIISTGKSKNTTRVRKFSGESDSEKLSSFWIRELDLSGYRDIPLRKKFSKIGRANLIFGTNGVGKTSLLEAIELLYCGNNRRTSGTGLEVSALLADGTRLTTGTSQKISDFDTRLRAWYGGENNSNVNKLISSFSRFNFLNTDAASELTLIGNGVAVKSNLDSLADLVSGPGTSTLWRRLNELEKELIGSKKEFETSRRLRASELQNIEAELKRLREGPERVDADYEILVRQLQRLEWKSFPTERANVDSRLVGELTGVAAQLGAVKRLSEVGTEYSLVAITARRTLLEECMDEASTKLKEKDERQRQKKVRLSQLEKLETLEKALIAIDLDLLQKYLEATAAQVQANIELNNIPSSFVDVISKTIFAVELSDAMQKNSIFSALANVLNESDESKRELEILSNELMAMKKLSTLQMELRVQIRQLAQQMIAHGHNDKSCPLCEMEFGAGELLSRIQRNIVDNEQAMLERAMSLKEQLESKVTRLKTQEAFIKNLDAFARAIEIDGSKVSISEALLKIEHEKGRGVRLAERVSELASELNMYRRAGIDEGTIKSLCSTADKQLFGLPLSVELVTEAIKIIVEERSKVIESTQADVVETLSGDSETVNKLISKAGLQNSSVTSFMEFISAARGVLSIYGTLIEVVEGLTNSLDIRPETDLQEVYALLYEVITLADTVGSAVERERADSEKFTQMTEAEKLKTVQLRDLSLSLEKVTSALATIADIVKNDSMEKASEQAISAAHAVANEVFARIHAPTEFAITTEGAHPLKRHSTGAKLTLNEISTGQRAAYMLSMFLAMNAQVQNGPKILMLDDPISHIDDLNALSFLDYLRDLVLAGQRQVFFATADEKIAGLFSHKFAFLDEEFRTIQLTR